jgi:hypothetical protein
VIARAALVARKLSVLARGPAIDAPTDLQRNGMTVAQRNERSKGSSPRMSHRSRRLLQVLALVVPLPAGAAPFCVHTESVPPQCIYYDAGSCNQRAAQMGGQCSVNPNDVRLTPSIGHYCLVTSGMASLCIYTDQTSCQQEAQRQRGACIIAPARPESPAADPYRDTRPSNAGGF